MLHGAAVLIVRGVETPPPREDLDAEEAERRRVLRLAGVIYQTWMQQISAGLAVAVAEHFDRRLRPLQGQAMRRTYRQVVPTSMRGSSVFDQGIVGISGRARSMEPQFGFFAAG